jgi:hypothetical protein
VWALVQDRKTIMKSCKGLVTRIAREEFGHLVLMRLFEVTDDTVAVQKLLLNVQLQSSVHVTFDVMSEIVACWWWTDVQELVKELPALVEDKFGGYDWLQHTPFQNDFVRYVSVVECVCCNCWHRDRRRTLRRRRWR